MFYLLFVFVEKIFSYLSAFGELLWEEVDDSN